MLPLREIYRHEADRSEVSLDNISTGIRAMSITAKINPVTN